MIWHCNRNAHRSSGLDPSNASGAQVRVCVDGAGTSICRGGFCGMAWPKVIKGHRRFCIISSAFFTAAAGGGIWGGGKRRGGVVLALGWGRGGGCRRVKSVGGGGWVRCCEVGRG